MIRSFLDNDMYKFTIQQCIVNQFPYAKAEYSFINRGRTKFPDNFHITLLKYVKEMSNLRLQPDENDYISRLPWLKPAFLDLLNGYRFDPDQVGISMTDNSDLRISISGPYYKTVLWEVPMMALISELYFRETSQSPEESWEDRAIDKAIALSKAGIKFSEFGTRRRFSYEVHDRVVSIMKKYAGDSLIGTSNVGLAMKYGLRPIGTQAHEFYSAHAAAYGYRMANQKAMETWINEYGGDMGIVLPDTFSTNAFIRSFDKKFALMFDGLRQDSGNPIEFVDKVIAHYKLLGIDPLTKTIIFSDNLDLTNILRIDDYCKGKIRCAFGIGTNLTNDVGVRPLNMVIKLSGFAIKPEDKMALCIKISDDMGKEVGDTREIDLCKRTLFID